MDVRCGSVAGSRSPRPTRVTRTASSSGTPPPRWPESAINMTTTRKEAPMSTTESHGTSIDGAVALVTGGNRGFGRALVDELLERGAAKVYATSRSAQPQRDDDRIVPLILDVTDDTSVAAAAQTATDVSILVNNAGINLRTPVLEAPLSDIRDELETNLFGILRVARAFAPVLAGQPRSSMVNVLSGLSWVSFGRGYEISKSAGWSATDALRLALRDQGTVVTALHVGYMDTDMTAKLDVS